MNLRSLCLCFGLVLCFPGLRAATDLERDFAQPPDSARPWVYWFPLDGNITSNGITADLEAMQRVGIGGVLYMETEQGTPSGPAAFGGPLWRALFKHACVEAHRLGLEVNMNNDAGWCGSGGPWITPELSMQKIVWSEMPVQGPRRLEAVLPQPETVEGFYRDIVLLAFPTPQGNARISHVREKADFSPWSVSWAPPARYGETPNEGIVSRGRILDLSSRMTAAGQLTWDVPEGAWTILRLGHTSTGKNNHPAPKAGRGLECDKLSREAVDVHFQGLMAKLVADLGPLAGSTLVSTHIDSWEVGYQNWTPHFREEFQKRRGYDLLRLMPAMTGRVVDSLEVSERFLWDLRQTISELLLENYAGHFRELAHQNNLRLSIEAYTSCPTDEMAYAGRADEPMGEFWSWSKYGAAFSCTEMASAAHVYGKRIVGAEAFTASDAERWQGYPGNIKELGDWAFCEGINRFVFHRYALQPWEDVRPGISMGPWGLHYERTQTWWEQSKAWHEYLARCQFLLRQGHFVAELCLLSPEGAPQTLSGQKSFLSGSPDHPDYPFERPAYNFDTCPPEVVLSRMSVRDGRIVLPDGMSYRALVLPQVETMTPQLLGKIAELVRAGATVVGRPPAKSPSLSGFPECDREVQGLVAELWGKDADVAEFTTRSVGQGQVVWGTALPSDGGATPFPQLSDARWIWYPEGNPAVAAPVGKRYFRRVLLLDEPVKSAHLAITADNAFECWVNGQPAGSGDNFGRVYRMEIRSALHAGTNILAVQAFNGADQPNPAGLIAELSIELENGRRLELQTDDTWLAAASVTGSWTTAAPPVGDWKKSQVLGTLGMAPWGDIEQSLASPEIYPDIARLCTWLQKTGVTPDFAYESRDSTHCLRYIHRTLDDAEIYFVANKSSEPEQALCSFRVAGKRPELWSPDTGRIQRIASYEERDGITRIPIQLGPVGSVFVVFRAQEGGLPESIVSVRRGEEEVISTSHPGNTGAIELERSAGGPLNALVREPGSYQLRDTHGRALVIKPVSLPEPIPVSGPWELSLPDPQSPQRLDLAQLVSWSRLDPPAARFFSGTGTYRATVHLGREYCGEGRRLFLDLGRVEVMAQVRVNGHDCGILWKKPFEVDVTDVVQAGDNRLEIQVVNLWINRLIGDEQLPEDSDRNPDGTLKSWPTWLERGLPSPTGRQTMTSWRLWKKDSPLQESGLLGPVVLRPARFVRIETQP